MDCDFRLWVATFSLAFLNIHLGRQNSSDQKLFVENLSSVKIVFTIRFLCVSIYQTSALTAVCSLTAEWSKNLKSWKNLAKECILFPFCLQEFEFNLQVSSGGVTEINYRSTDMILPWFGTKIKIFQKSSKVSLALKAFSNLFLSFFSIFHARKTISKILNSPRTSMSHEMCLKVISLPSNQLLELSFHS